MHFCVITVLIECDYCNINNIVNNSIINNINRTTNFFKSIRSFSSRSKNWLNLIALLIDAPNELKLKKWNKF